MKYIMMWLVRLYQKFISPIKPSCCRFTPTCSDYAYEAFRTRGFFVGLALSVWRILRCNPFSKGGYDPVPPPWRPSAESARKMVEACRMRHK